MANNYKFRDVDDMVLYIDNILSEKPTRNILDCIENKKTHAEVISYLQQKLLNGGDITKVINRLSEEEINRVYYKNNLLEFLCNNKYIKTMRDVMEEEFVNKPSEKNIVAFNEMLEDVLQFVYYGYIVEDRFVCATEGMRDVIIVVDTDLTLGPLDRDI